MLVVANPPLGLFGDAKHSPSSFSFSGCSRDFLSSAVGCSGVAIGSFIYVMITIPVFGLELGVLLL